MLIHDIATIASLILLEGLLSADNALVLAVLVRHLPPAEQKRALKYGIFGAFFFRFLSLLLVTWMLQAWYIKLIGAAYLLYIGIHHLLTPTYEDEARSVRGRGFWGTVVAVELTDIVFSVDSILAAVAMSDKLWVIYLGGILGIVAMRFVAGGFLKVIERFPALVHGAYVLVIWIGLKLLFGGWEATVQALGPNWGWTVEQIEARHWHMPGWVFWLGMLSILTVSLLWERIRGKK